MKYYGGIMKVRVYFNLHRKCFSVQHKTIKGWRLLKHVDNIFLKKVTFHVREAGRQRVLKEKKKNVHAWVEGEEAAWSLANIPVFYNPYKAGNFVNDRGVAVFAADQARLDKKKIFIN